MATTNHLAITLLEQSQAQKEVTANEAFARIDAVLNTGAIDRALGTPPALPNEGDVYIVATSATDDWAGQEDALAYYDGGVWRFVTPNEGMQIWLNSEDKLYTYFNAEWNADTNHWRGHDQSQYHNLKILSDGATINWDVRYNPVATVTLGGNRSLANPSNMMPGGVYRLIVRQDGSGGRSLGFGSAYAFIGSSAPSVSSAANAVDLFTFIYDGSHMLGTYALNIG